MNKAGKKAQETINTITKNLPMWKAVAELGELFVKQAQHVGELVERLDGQDVEVDGDWTRERSRDTEGHIQIKNPYGDGAAYGWLRVQKTMGSVWKWDAASPVDAYRNASGEARSELGAYTDALAVVAAWGFEVPMPSWVNRAGSEPAPEED